MTTVLRMLSRSSRLRHGLLVLALVGIAVAAGAFALDTEGATPDPVAFGETTTTGLAAEDRRVLSDRNLSVPRVEVFYSQYKYVVGYWGVEYAVTSLNQEGHEQQFGYPIAVYVSDFAGTNVSLTDGGYLRTETDPGWVDASAATFVVGSEARTPSGGTVVPFGSEVAAESFATVHGGETADWERVQRRAFDIDDVATVRERVTDRHARADERVASARDRLDRDPVLVVGEDGDTIQGTIDAAPPNATVRLPAGTYDEKPVVDKPLTLRGESATVRGDGNGSVLRVTADGVAVTGVSVTGVGDRLEPPESVGDDDTATDSGRWDSAVELAYGYADAGIVANGTSDLYVGNVTVETPANGVLLRNADRTVVEGLTVEGADHWSDGLMGLMALRSPVIVQNSTFDAGRDGVYLHRAHGTVVRDSTFLDNRFGVHYMYTSDALTADNSMRRQTSGGLTIMTSSTRHAVVGNDIRNASSAILPTGSRNYFAGNVLAHSGLGIATATDNSLYERNVIYGNDVGLRADSLRPTNRVVANDIVANDRHAETTTGPLYIWTHDGRGNYWGGATGGPGGGAYTPTDPIQGQQHRVTGAAALASSPAMRLIESFRGAAPGMRDATIVDTAPRAQPVQPDVLAALRSERDE